MEWTNRKVLELLDFYYKQPLLWNSSLKKKKDEEERLKIYEEISAELGISPEIVKSKMETLKTQYDKEIEKEKHYRANGSLYKSRWFAFDAMARTRTEPSSDEDDKENNRKLDEKAEQNNISEYSEEPFCLHVANELKNIKDPDIQAIVKFKINRILFKAATGSYKNVILSDQKEDDSRIENNSDDDL